MQETSDQYLEILVLCVFSPNPRTLLILADFAISACALRFAIFYSQFPHVNRESGIYSWDEGIASRVYFWRDRFRSEDIAWEKRNLIVRAVRDKISLSKFGKFQFRLRSRKRQFRFHFDFAHKFSFIVKIFVKRPLNLNVNHVTSEVQAPWNNAGWDWTP